MCSKNTWLLIKKASVFSDLISGITAEEINPTSQSYDDKIKSYNPYGDKAFNRTIEYLSDKDHRWTDKLPWNSDEHAYRTGKMQEVQAKYYKEDYTKRIKEVQKYWEDTLADYKDKWLKTHNNSTDDISKDTIYKKLVKATKKFTPTKFFEDFKEYVPPANKQKEKGLLGTIFQAKWLKKIIKNKLILGSLGFK